MRLHRTKHTAHFTVIGNNLLRQHSLSFTARGLLGYLLSLPDAAREDVRTLAKRSREGRTAISRALNELEDAGLYVRHTIRDPETGRVWTEVDVYEVAPVAGESEPLPASPAVGARSVGKPGTLPTGVKTREKNLPTPAADEQPARTPHAAVSGPVGGAVGDESQSTPESAAAARVLALVSHSDPRLTLGVAEVLALAPLAAEWLNRGASERTIRAALTTGLPEQVHSAAALVRSRLTRKLPPEKPAALPTPRRHHCQGCAIPVDVEGRCGACRSEPAEAQRGLLTGSWRQKVAEVLG